MQALVLPNPATLLLFAAAALVLLVIPGPAVMYIVTRGVSQGRRAGVVSALAVGVGNFCHAFAATLGLSAVLYSSALAFSVVKFAGAAFLIYLGVRTLLAREAPSALPVAERRPLRRIFWQGLVVAVLNPKTALFFLAFLPQFVSPTRGAVPPQILLLGCLFAILGVCSDSLYGVLAGTLRGWLNRNTRYPRRQRQVIGTLYVGLGCTAALSGAHSPTAAHQN